MGQFIANSTFLSYTTIREMCSAKYLRNCFFRIVYLYLWRISKQSQYVEIYQCPILADNGLLFTN